jgi:thioredoxin-like negative regulator of GroEL
LPEIDQVTKEADVPFVAVAVGDRDDSANRSKGLTQATVVESTDQALEQLGIEAVPATLILKNGSVIDRVNGPVDASDLEKRLADAASS